MPETPLLQNAVLARALMVGLTPLIPVPWVDDVVRAALERRLFRAVAAGCGRPLGPADLAALVDEAPGGCGPGCLLTLVVYPVKRIFRKIFFFIEVKRAVDLCSRSYHRAWLLQAALQEGWLQAGDPVRARAVRAAIDAVCDEIGVTPVERAFRETLRGSTSVLRAAAALLERTLRGAGRQPEQVAQALDAAEPAEEQAVQGLVGRLQQALASVPREHFLGLRTRLEARLAAAGQAPA